MAKLDPATRQVVRLVEYEAHGQAEPTLIADDEKRRKAVSNFIRQQLQDTKQLRETQPQRRVRKSGLEECIKAIRKREDNCYCPRTLIQAATKAGKGLCTVCQRARDALQLWIQVERLINRRLELKRDYFTAICNAHKDVVNPPMPAEPPALQPGDVIAGLEARRAMDDENNAGRATQKIG